MMFKVSILALNVVTWGIVFFAFGYRRGLAEGVKTYTYNQCKFSRPVKITGDGVKLYMSDCTFGNVDADVDTDWIWFGTIKISNAAPINVRVDTIYLDKPETNYFISNKWTSVPGLSNFGVKTK